MNATKSLRPEYAGPCYAGHPLLPNKDDVRIVLAFLIRLLAWWRVQVRAASPFEPKPVPSAGAIPHASVVTPVCVLTTFDTTVDRYAAADYAPADAIAPSLVCDVFEPADCLLPCFDLSAVLNAPAPDPVKPKRTRKAPAPKKAAPKKREKVKVAANAPTDPPKRRRKTT